MKNVFLALFCVFSLIHLIDSWRDDARRRARTKPFLLLFLSLYYLFAAQRLSIPLLCALLASWLGDLLLIPKGHRWFAAGGLSFGAAHLLFITVYFPFVGAPRSSWLLLFPAALLYYGISFKIIAALRTSAPSQMLPPMYLYLLTNSTMNLFALLQFLNLQNAGALTAFLGALLFFVSDCTLFLVRYHRKRDLIFKRHFTVMLTYLTGELLIVLGMLQISGGA